MSVLPFLSPTDLDVVAAERTRGRFRREQGLAGEGAPAVEQPGGLGPGGGRGERSRLQLLQYSVSTGSNSRPSAAE